MNFELIPSDVDPTKPLIYLWEIFDTTGALRGRYVGKAEGGSGRPLKHYKRNVIKLMKGLPYKKGKQYRKVHHGLADAVSAGHRITLKYLCNVHRDENIFAVEGRYIEELGCLEANGIGLNGRRQSHQVGPIVAEHYVSEKVITRRLEDIEQWAKINHPEVVTKWGSRRVSIFIGEHRLFRAEQAGPRSNVRIKLAQTSLRDKVNREITWEGSNTQLEAILSEELYVQQNQR